MIDYADIEAAKKHQHRPIITDQVYPHHCYMIIPKSPAHAAPLTTAEGKIILFKIILSPNHFLIPTL